MTEKVEKLSAMTDAQLRAFLFGDHYDEMSFADVTADFMQKMAQTEADSEKTTAEMMNSESDTQNTVTSLTQSMSNEYIKELQEQQDMQPSSMPSWLSDVVNGLMAALSILTLNPAIIGMSLGMFVLNFQAGGKSLMSMMEDSAGCGDDPSKKAAFEFGFALGAAAMSGGVSVGGDAYAASSAAENGVQVAAKTAGQMALNLAKYTFTYLGQALLLDNFWPDFFQGPCKMSQEDAALLGMFVGIGFGIASTAVANGSEDGFTQILRDKVSKLSDSAHTIFRLVSTTLFLAGDGFEMASGVDSIKISNQFKALAAFEKDTIAPTMGKLAIVQTLATGLSGMMNVTQNLLQTLGDDSVAINQTFSSYADMFRPAQG